jgi:transducin (beta)-like 1
MTGFQHAAFTFGYESLVHKSDINGNDVPPGALISFIQKGLQYIEVEANLNADGSLDENTPSDFTLLQPDELLTKNVSELRRSIQKKKEQRSQAEKLKQKQRDELNGGKSKKSKILHKSSSNDKLKLNKAEKSSAGGPTPMDEDSKEDNKNNGDNNNSKQVSSVEKEELQIPAEDVTTLRAHSSEVFIIQWSPQSSLLASGSGDSTARIWDVNQTDKDKSAEDPVCLRHTNSINMNSNNNTGSGEEGAGTPGTTAAATAAAASKSRDVTTLDWSSNGNFLATGSYDGQARVWDTQGKLMKTLNGHRGPIFSLKWNKEGNLLLSGSVDKTAIVWDVNSSQASPGDGLQSVSNSNILQQYSLHAAPTLDVDWRTNDSFATCSTDTMIYVCKLGEAAPIKTFSAHKDEVNAINWDNSGTYLASCSDDCTAKVWTLDDDKPLYNFTDHTREIYTIKWSPTSTGSANPNKPLLLASASFDATIRLWEMESGKCLYELSKHLDPVYSVAFSPCGDYLATGSFDRHLHIWSVKTGKHLRTFKGEGGIFEVCWNKDGDKVAACFSNSTVSIIDFKYHKGDTF